MTPTVEKRKAFLINVAYVVFIIGAFFLFVKYLFGAFVPLIVSFIIALLLQKPVNFIERKTPLSRGITSALLSLLCFSAFIALLVLVGAKIIVEVKDFIASVVAGFENLNGMTAEIKEWLLNLSVIRKLPKGVRESVISVVNDIIAKVTSSQNTSSSSGSVSKIDLSLLSTPLSSVWTTAKQIPSVLIGFVITMVSTCFMTADYPRVHDFIFRQMSDEKNEKLSKAKVILTKSLGKILKAYAFIVLITTVELIIGLEILTVLKVYPGDYILIISFITALIDIVPVLGTGTVIIPWAIYSFIVGNSGMGIGLLVIYVVILIIRQIIEPKLVAGQVDMSPVVTITAMYLGTKFLGVLGIFILPFLCIVVKLLNDEGIIHIFKKKIIEEENAK